MRHRKRAATFGNTYRERHPTYAVVLLDFSAFGRMAKMLEEIRSQFKPLFNLFAKEHKRSDYTLAGPSNGA